MTVTITPAIEQYFHTKKTTLHTLDAAIQAFRGLPREMVLGWCGFPMPMSRDSAAILHADLYRQLLDIARAFPAQVSLQQVLQEAT